MIMSDDTFYGKRAFLISRSAVENILNDNEIFEKMGFLGIGARFEIFMSLKIIGIAILIFSFSQSALHFDFIFEYLTIMG
jgi:hypothetical protein